MMNIWIVVLFLATSTNLPAWSLKPLTMLTAHNTTMPGCPRKCGNLTVPYPFGVGLGAGCSRKRFYDIFCVDSFDPPKAFLPTAQYSTPTSNPTIVEVVEISETHVRLTSRVAFQCYNSTAPTTDIFSTLNFGLLDKYAPYIVSGARNKLIMVGCNSAASFSGQTSDFYTLPLDHQRGSSRCETSCSSDRSSRVAGDCDGVGCCQATIPNGTRSFTVILNSVGNHSETFSYNPCVYAFIGDANQFKFRGRSDLTDSDFVSRTVVEVSVVLEWVIRNSEHDPYPYACQQNTAYIDASDSGVDGYRCRCLPGYQGNPYLSPGCSDINECADPNDTPCSMTCTNTPGNYTCSCPSGYSGDGRKDGTGCTRRFPVLQVALGVGCGALLLLVGITLMILSIRRRRVMKRKEKFFQQNGGLLLSHLISSSKEDSTEHVKIFTIEELEAATNNFNEQSIVGRGGYGTVFKGNLSNDEIVAIKRSKFVEKSQIEQFINELVILARIKHPNVVRLIGCCLEVEVPLLVYEFIPNGTLYDHIHNKDGPSWYSWRNCLRIAIDAASALAYLHLKPIVHRDVKSTNILLDDNYMAKVSDFGASRLVPLNHTHLTTMVQGTLGYLDPQYFISSQLTEKSDVYSFGVVLTELLTREKPLLPPIQAEDRNQNLAAFFVNCLEQNNLFNILHSELLAEASKEQLISIAELVRKCLSIKGENRPTMKEVVMELEELWRNTTQCM